MTEPDRTRDLRVQLLGPVRAWLGDREADLGTARRRALFTILALRGGTVVARDELTDGLWANRTPANPAGSIYTYVNGLRDALEPGRDPHTRSSWLVSEAPGYRLRVEESQVDAARFVAHLTMGRALMADDPAAAVVEFDAALALWQPDGGAVKPSGVLSGDPDGGAVKPSGVLSGKNVPLADVDGPFVRAARMQLVEQRFGLVEDRARALIELGRRDDAIPGLLTLTEQYPLREGPRGLLMLALHRDGRTAEALAVFEDLRGVLVEALGVDPSPALSLLRDRIVSDDPALGHGTPGPGEPMPVAPAPSVPGQLPADVATFTGRGTELARLRNLVTGEPSVANTPAIGVISGTAGVGKTALAVRFAHELAGEFPDGQLFVNLRGFDPNEEPASAAQALIRLTNDLGSRPPNEPESEDELGGRYRSLIAGKRMLVVLDNALSSEQVRPLLPGTFSCLVLVTSRNRLAGLVARDGARMLDLGPLPPPDAEHMLATILGAQHADNGTELGKLAECCGHLPLALGIAAHRLTAHPELSAADVVTELSNENDRLRLLSLPGSGAVRQVLSWSYRVLKPQPARLFRLLGLHPSVEISGGAAAALNGTPHAVTRRLLDALVLGNLLERIGRDRYRIHDLLRLYAMELVAVDESERERLGAHQRLFDWYLHTASNANRVLEPQRAPRRLPLNPRPADCEPVSFADLRAARTWMRTEQENVLGAVRAAHRLGMDRYVWQIAANLWEVVWEVIRLGGRLDDLIDAKKLAVEATLRAGDTYAEMWSRTVLGHAYLFARRVDEAQECFDTCRAYWNGRGADTDRSALFEAIATLGLAVACQLRGEFAGGLEYAGQAISALRDHGDTGSEGWALCTMGFTNLELGRLDEALSVLRKGLIVCRAHDARLARGFLLLALADVTLRLGRAEDAVAYLRQALTLSVQEDDPYQEITAHDALARALGAIGRTAEAREHEQRTVSLTEQCGIPLKLREALGPSAQDNH